MNWLLLNQLCVNSESKNYKMCVLEEVLSSEVQLVLLLVSGTVSQVTMISHGHGLLWNNQVTQGDRL